MEIRFKDSPYIVLDIEMAKVLGLEKAVIMRKILGWIKHNMKNHKNRHEPYPNYREGRYWVYNSLNEWEEDIQVMKRDRIHRHLRALEVDKWLLTGNFNKRSWDKTVWYTIEFVKFFGKFPHLGNLTSEGAVGISDDPSQNATAHRKMRQPDAKCDNNTNKHNSTNKTQLSKHSLPSPSVTPSPSALGESFGIENVVPGITGQILISEIHGETVHCAIFFNGKLWTEQVTMRPGESLGDCYQRYFRNEQKGTASELEVPTPKKHMNPGKGPVSFDPDDLIIAKAWLSFALGEMKWKTPKGSWTENRFAEEFAKVRRVTGINPQGLHALLAFVRKDDFWRPNALSPAGLLKKSANGNRKIDNILLKMKPKGQSKYEKALEAVEAMEHEDKQKKANPIDDPF